MSKQFNTSNQLLYMYHNEIENMKNSVFYLFNRSKINDFYRDNGIRIQGILNKLIEIRHKYFQHDKEDKVIFGEDNKAILIEGKTLEEHDEEYIEFMQIKCPLIV